MAQCESSVTATAAESIPVKAAVWVRRLPWSIVAAALLLIGLGWLGIARVEELTEGSGRFLHQQMAYSVIALVVMLAMTLFNYRMLARFSYALFLAGHRAAGGRVSLARPINGAHRWIRFGPVGLQPSDLAKLAFILAMARYLMYRDNYRRLRGLLAPLALTLVPVLLILKEPDLGTALVFLPVFFVMLFAAGAKRSDLACVALAGLLVLPLLWTQMSLDQKSRITALFDQPPPDRRPSDDAYQLYQAKRMRALGGVWGSLSDRSAHRRSGGLSFARGRKRFHLLASWASVLACRAWRWCWVCSACWWREGVAIAAETREPFGRLLATGVTALLAVEVLINTGMNVGLLPVNGLSLPLVSYGGSGLVAHAMALGLLLNVGLRPGYEMTNEPFRW